MREVTFTLPGVDGEFTADADEVRSYKSVKQIARGEQEPEGVFEVMERVFERRDEEYIARVGGTIDDMNRLLNGAMEAAGAKNSSASPQTSRPGAAK